MIAETIYILCAGTSAACAAMLIRGWVQSRARLLLWCAICFVMLAVNNLMLLVDEVVFPERTLLLLGLKWGTWRGIVAFVGISSLCWGLLWESDGRKGNRAARGIPAERSETL